MDSRERVHRVKVAFENVDLNSNSGPNSFGLKLYKEFLRKGIGVDYESPDVRLAIVNVEFVGSQVTFPSVYPRPVATVPQLRS